MRTFRYIGTTDECIECQKCGKIDLRSTIVLAVLDDDGNTEDITYYGSTCAARALAVRGGGRAVLDAARGKHRETLAAATDARRTLAFYGLPETGEVDDPALVAATAKFMHAHSNAVWFTEKTDTDWRRMVLDMLARRRTQIAEASLVGGV